MRSLVSTLIVILLLLSPSISKADDDANHCVEFTKDRIVNNCSDKIYVQWFHVDRYATGVGSQCKNGCGSIVSGYKKQTSIGIKKYRKEFAACFWPETPKKFDPQSGRKTFWCE